MSIIAYAHLLLVNKERENVFHRMHLILCIYLFLHLICLQCIDVYFWFFLVVALD